MAKFTTGDQASTAALSRVDTLLQTINTDADYALWREWIYDRAIAKLALGLTGGGGSSTSILAGFKAIANGTGYSIGDLIFLRQTGTNQTEYYNGTTGLVITPAPPSSDLGSIISSSNVAVTSLPPLPSGANTIGAISNASFGISGSLPAFASTPTVNIGTTGAIATDSTLQQVRDAIKAQIDIASTIWTDNTDTFYVRRDLVNEGTGVITVSFTLPDGTAATPSAGLRPLATVDKDVLSDYYDVLIAGTGYAIGDLLARVAIIDANGASPTSTFIWLNLTAGTILGTAPSSANIERANETIGARQSGTWNITNISGTVSLPTGASTSANQATAISSLGSIDGKLPASLGVKTAANSLAVTLSTDGIASGIDTKIGEVQTTPTANTVLARLKNIADALVFGAKSPANSISVTQAFAATSTLANVASSATSVSLLAANNNRKTAIILNDSTSDLYVTLNASAASTTNYSLFLAAKVGNTPSFLAINGDDYSGEIRGIWSSANGFARITEVV